MERKTHRRKLWRCPDCLRHSADQFCYDCNEQERATGAWIGGLTRGYQRQRITPGHYEEVLR